MSAPMTFSQLKELLQHIDKEHSPIRYHKTGKTVKYVDPHIDMRTGHVFAVKLRGYGWEELFHTQNECIDLEASLFERIMTFLDGEQT